MDEAARRRKRHMAEIAALAAFVAVLLSTPPWLVYLASLVIFRLDPGAMPDSFWIVYQTAGGGHAVIDGRRYPPLGAGQGIRSFRLTGSGDFFYGKGKLSFAVLEDDGKRQVVEVRYEGLNHTVSRYAAYADRVVPISYRSLGWGYENATVLPAAMVALALGILAAWGVFAAASRLARLEQT